MGDLYTIKRLLDNTIFTAKIIPLKEETPADINILLKLEDPLALGFQDLFINTDETQLILVITHI